MGTSVHIRYLPRHSFLVDQSLELWIPTVVDSEEDVCLDGKEIRSRCNERLKAKSEVPMYTPRIHWVVWGTRTPKDRDEVKREGILCVYLHQNKKRRESREKNVTVKL